MIMTSTRLFAAAAALALWAAPALAQGAKLDNVTEAQEDEIFCVYDEIENDIDLVAEQFLYDNLSAGDKKKADAALAAAGDACAATYNWDNSRRDRAKKVGLYATVADFLELDLVAENVKDEDIDRIYTILGSLPDADLNRFLNESWLDDEAFIARINAALAAGGFPKGDDDFQFETARLIMEVSALAADTISEWVATYLK